MISSAAQTFLDTNSQSDPQKRLEALVALLRGPDGCPWDQRQDAASIIDCVIDEAHELKEALARGERRQVVEELGDLAFTFTFLCQTLQHQATYEAATELVVEKMIARHPHVFAGETKADEQEIKRTWEGLKTAGAASQRRLDRDLAASLPAWKKAEKVLNRARNSGFRYADPKAAWEKVAEEWAELQEALDGDDQARQEAELGDLLLALVTAAKENGLDGQRALVGSATTFADRLERVEQLAGQPLSEIPYAELATWYERARRQSSESHGAYFNYCGVSPWPGRVSRAVSRAARMLARQGLGGALTLRQEREQLRQAIASLVAGPPDGVVFVPNISQAGLAVGYCLDWQPGDTVLLGLHEFPANHLPWRLAAKTFGVAVELFDDDLLRREPERGWATLEQTLQELRPRLLAASVVSYWSGYRIDVERLAALCKEHGTLLYLDAIQALGTSEMRMVDGVSFLAGGSHKSLLSPEGAGFLLVAPEVRQHWTPRLSGWLGLPDPVDFLLDGNPRLDPNLKEPRPQDPSSLEGGSLNALGYAGLAGALEHLAEIGVGNIARQVQSLHDLLEPGMTALGFTSLRSPDESHRSSILSFLPPPGVDVAKLQLLLGQAGVAASIPRGVLRFGFHYSNREADVVRLLATIPRLLERAVCQPPPANLQGG